MYKYDISLPVSDMYKLVDDMRQRVGHLPGVLVTGYGHVGDGNLHLNVSSHQADPQLEDLIEPYVYE